jgi:putative ABC transport system substrate-binding protein
MRRREFITLLGGAASLPLAARAQQRAMPVIGYLDGGSSEPSRVAAFHKGLSESGYVEGRNVGIEYRGAHNEVDRLPELAADLVRRRVAVIVTSGITSVLAAKAATTTIPIVFGTGADPIQDGLVPRQNRPGGNVTGITSIGVEITPKRLGLLHEPLPRAARFAVLVNPNDANAASTITDVRAAASTIGRQIEVFSQAPIGKSRQPLRALRKIGPTHSWSFPASSSSIVVSNSPRWRRTIGCRRAIPRARMSKPAG